MQQYGAIQGWDDSHIHTDGDDSTSVASNPHNSSDYERPSLAPKWLRAIVVLSAVALVLTLSPTRGDAPNKKSLAADNTLTLRDFEKSSENFGLLLAFDFGADLAFEAGGVSSASASDSRLALASTSIAGPNI